MPGYSVIAADVCAKSRLECVECKLVLKDAVQTEEGVRLCESCFNKISKEPNCKSQKTGVCVAGEDGKPSCFLDKAARQDVQQLLIVCKNKTLGCKWSGKLGTYFQEHEEHCQIPCEYCGVTVACHDIQKHRNTCSKYPVSCRLCDCKVPRIKMGDHVNSECQYIACACGEVLKRDAQDDDAKSMAFHLKNPEVLFLHFVAIMALGNSVIQRMKLCEDRVSAFEETVRSLHSSSSEVESRIRAHSSQIKDLKECSARQKETINAARTQIKDLKEHAMHQTEVVRANSSQIKDLEEQIVHQEEILHAYLSQINDLRREIERLNSTSQYPSNYGLQRPYNLDAIDHFQGEISVLCNEVQQLQNCVYIWKISNLERHKHDALEGRVTSLYSPPFHTAQFGYKMCIKAFLDGDGMGYKTHLSLFFVLMKGEFDALLKWPFKNKVSLILVDQNHRKPLVQTFKPTPESSSFQRPISDMNVASGCPQFCELSYLSDESYTKGDTLFIKCIVDTSRHYSAPDSFLI